MQLEPYGADAASLRRDCGEAQDPILADGTGGLVTWPIEAARDFSWANWTERTGYRLRHMSMDRRAPR